MKKRKSILKIIVVLRVETIIFYKKYFAQIWDKFKRCNVTI